MLYKIKRFFKKIIRVIEFIKLGWHDEDWDFYYLLKLIEFKCTKMRSYLGNSQVLIDSDKLDIIIGLNRTLYYIKCYTDPYILYKDKYGEFPLEVSHRTVPCENGCYRMVTINKKTGAVLSEEEEKVYHEYIITLNNLEQESWNKIFETISKEGQKWWD